VMTRYGGPGTGSAAISASSASAPVVSSPSNCAVRPRSRRSASRGRLIVISATVYRCDRTQSCGRYRNDSK
jgi:hypothetical protein